MAFTWFDKLTNVLDKVPEDLQPEFVLGVVNYGAKDIEPEFEFPLDAIFEGIREDIDNSKKARNNNKGGRPKSEKPHRSNGNNGGSDVEETPVSETKKQGVIETEKPTVSKTENPPFSDVKTGGSDVEETPPYINQTKPSQANTSQDRLGQGVLGGQKRKRFRPPAPEEVKAYCDENGLMVDANRFCDFYASKGWTVGKSPMKSWKHAARNWDREERARNAPKHEVVIGNEYARAFDDAKVIR